MHWRTTGGRELLALPLVCRSWALPAQKILFQSVEIVGSSSAVRFLRTAEARPDLVDATRALSIAPADQQRERLASGNDRLGYASTSLDLVRVVKECHSLRHLEIHPLHFLARPALVSVLADKSLDEPLVSLVVSQGWSGFYLDTDLSILVLPSLRHLELTYGVDDDPLAPRSRPPVLLAPTPIVRLSLSITAPSHHYNSLITAIGPTLEEADLYFAPSDSQTLGDWMDPKKSVKAWTTTLSSLRRLRIYTNHESDGEVIWFDELLPHFKRLERLSVGSCEFTPRHSSTSSLLPSLPRSGELRRGRRRAAGRPHRGGPGGELEHAARVPPL